MSIQGSRLRRSGFQPVHQAKRDFVVLQRPTLSSNASRLGSERRTQGAAGAEVGDLFAQHLIDSCCQFLQLTIVIRFEPREDVFMSSTNHTQ